MFCGCGERAWQWQAGGFTVEKRLSVGNLITIITVLAGGLFSWAQMQGRVDILQDKIDRVTQEVEKRADQWDDMKSRMIRVEEKLANQNELLKQIADSLKTQRQPQ